MALQELNAFKRLQIICQLMHQTMVHCQLSSWLLFAKTRRKIYREVRPPSERDLFDRCLEARRVNLKLLIYSDVHRERQQFSPGPNAREADLVMLAGDIGPGTEGLHLARKTFKNQPIIMVLGNHEFFGGRDFVEFVDEC